MSYITGFISGLFYTKPTIPEFTTYNDRFAQYVQEHCPGYTEERARSLFTEGERFIAHMQAKGAPSGDPKDYLSPFMWSLIYRACENNEGFSQGTFVVKDPGYALERFFCRSKLCYRRWSTHFPKRTKIDPLCSGGSNTYAIDIPQDQKLGLPAHKRTVIFSAIETLDGEEYTFFKIEDWGFTGIISKLCHTKDYLLYLPRLCFPKWLGKHALPHFREELIRPAILDRFHSVAGKTLTPDLAKKVKRYGLSGIDLALSMIEETNMKAKELLNEIRSEHGDLTQRRVRTGREVVIGPLSPLIPAFY